MWFTRKPWRGGANFPLPRGIRTHSLFPLASACWSLSAFGGRTLASDQLRKWNRRRRTKACLDGGPASLLGLGRPPIQLAAFIDTVITSDRHLSVLLRCFCGLDQEESPSGFVFTNKKATRSAIIRKRHGGFDCLVPLVVPINWLAAAKVTGSFPDGVTIGFFG
jgi:hypothetical protein